VIEITGFLAAFSLTCKFGISIHVFSYKMRPFKIDSNLERLVVAILCQGQEQENDAERRTKSTQPEYENVPKNVSQSSHYNHSYLFIYLFIFQHETHILNSGKKLKRFGANYLNIHSYYLFATNIFNNSEQILSHYVIQVSDETFSIYNPAI
jgi:sulfatase maturation enzyme AslB (radical SAM superfamily)